MLDQTQTLLVKKQQTSLVFWRKLKKLDQDNETKSNFSQNILMLETRSRIVNKIMKQKQKAMELQIRWELLFILSSSRWNYTNLIDSYQGKTIFLLRSCLFLKKKQKSYMMISAYKVIYLCSGNSVTDVIFIAENINEYSKWSNFSKLQQEAWQSANN